MEMQCVYGVLCAATWWTFAVFAGDTRVAQLLSIHDALADLAERAVVASSDIPEAPPFPKATSGTDIPEAPPLPEDTESPTVHVGSSSSPAPAKSPISTPSQTALRQQLEEARLRSAGIDPNLVKELSQRRAVIVDEEDDEDEWDQDVDTSSSAKPTVKEATPPRPTPPPPQPKPVQPAPPQSAPVPYGPRPPSVPKPTRPAVDSSKPTALPIQKAGGNLPAQGPRPPTVPKYVPAKTSGSAPARPANVAAARTQFRPVVKNADASKPAVVPTSQTVINKNLQEKVTSVVKEKGAPAPVEKPTENKGIVDVKESEWD